MLPRVTTLIPHNEKIVMRSMPFTEPIRHRLVRSLFSDAAQEGISGSAIRMLAAYAFLSVVAKVLRHCLRRRL